MGTIEFRLVDPVADGTQIPVGWNAYRSTKTLFEMLEEEVCRLMAVEGLSRRAAQAKQVRSAEAALDLLIAGR